MSNRNISMISREELEAEYEQSQWALAWALQKLGGKMSILDCDVRYGNKCRIWYKVENGYTDIELREDDGT